MNSSDSLRLDEHLARLLAAYDQGIEGGDGKAPTVGVSPFVPPETPGERPVSSLHGPAANQGSLGEVLPNPENRVTLADERDEHGVPVARVTFSFGENDRAIVEAGTELATQALEAAGMVRGAPDPADGRQTLLSLTWQCESWLTETRSLRDDWLSRSGSGVV